MRLVLFVAVACIAACKMENEAFNPGSSDDAASEATVANESSGQVSSSESAGETISGSTGVSATGAMEDSGTEIGDTGTDDTTVATTDTTDTTGTDDSADEGTTTTGESVCMFDEGTKLNVVVKKNDTGIAGSCGQSISIRGPVVATLKSSAWTVKNCGGCDDCASDSYDVGVMAAAGWTPTLEGCVAMEIEYEGDECAFSGITIWDVREAVDVPRYVGSTGVIHAPSSAEALGIVVHTEYVERCMCTDATDPCCTGEQGRYKFVVEGLGETLYLYEFTEQTLPIGVMEAHGRNLQSHIHDLCSSNQSDHFDWVVKFENP